MIAAGCDIICIASNTGHLVVPKLLTMHPGLKVLHIGDCTAHAIKAKGYSRVGLLGTEPTMRESYLKDQLAKHGIETLVPVRRIDALFACESELAP